MFNALIPLVLPTIFAVVDPGMSAPPPAAPQEEIVVAFDGDGTTLVDFASFVSGQLGKQIFFDQREVEGVMIQARGSRTVKKQDFRGFAETTLYAHGFILLPIGDALRLTSMINSRSATSIRTQAEFVPLDELSRYEGRYVVITCVIPVKARSASSMAGVAFQGGGAQEHVNALTAYFQNPMIESIRSSGDSIVVTGFPHVVAHALHVVQELEKQRTEVEAPVAQRIAALEAELNALKQQQQQQQQQKK